MNLEFAIQGFPTGETYEIVLSESEGGGTVEWGPMVRGIVADVRGGVPPGLISAKFHNSLAEAIVAVALAAGEKKVLLSGGVSRTVI